MLFRSLRTHGPNATLVFHSTARIVITTTSGHHLLYSITPADTVLAKRGNTAYVLPGGDKGSKAWPRGPGEGRDVEGIVLREEGTRGMAVGDGVGW